MVARLAVTIAGLAVLYAGRRFAMPLVGAVTAGPHGTGGQVSFLFLGLATFAGAYLFAELVSLFTPWGQRLRHAGVEGRRKINRLALALGAVAILAQTGGIAYYFTRIPYTWDGGAAGSSGWVLWATLAASGFAEVGLAALISAFGLGNGFAILFTASLLYPAENDPLAVALHLGDHDPEWWLMSVVTTALVVALVAAFLRRRPVAEVVPATGEPLPFRIPPFPQGDLPLVLTAMAISTATTTFPFQDAPLVALGPWGHVAALAAGILVLSPLAAWMFSGREMVDANLVGVAAVRPESFRARWWRRVVLAALVLVAGELGPWLLGAYLPDAATVLSSFTAILFLAALGLDLWHEAALLRRGPVERVLTLDNPHLAEYLRAVLAREGVPCAVRAYRFRLLLYFLGPLFKMALLVPAAEAERAARIVDETPFQVV